MVEKTLKTKDKFEEKKKDNNKLIQSLENKFSIYDELEEYDNCFKAKHNNLYDIFNTKGELVLHDIKEIKSYKRKMACLGHHCNEHVYVVQNKENKWGMYNSNFKAIIPCQYKSISNITKIKGKRTDFFSLGYFIAVDENDKSSVYSILNDKAIKNEYEKNIAFIIMHPSRGVSGWVIRDEKQRYGCLDRFFRVAIPCQYMKNFHDVTPYVTVAQDEKGYYSFWSIEARKKLVDNIVAYTPDVRKPWIVYVKSINGAWFKIDFLCTPPEYTKCDFNKTSKKTNSKQKRKIRRK